MTSPALTPTQFAIVGYLACRAGAWAHAKDILLGVFPPGRNVANVKVQVRDAISRGAPIETDCGLTGSATRVSRGYRYREPAQHAPRDTAEGLGGPISTPVHGAS